VYFVVHCVSKNCTLFIFAITLSILCRFKKILAMIHRRKIVIKPVLYFSPHLFSAPLLYLVTQATNLTDIHSDKHQNRTVKSGKSQDKKVDKTFKNKSRQSEQVLKVSSVSFHTFTQISNFYNAIFNAERCGE